MQAHTVTELGPQLPGDPFPVRKIELVHQLPDEGLAQTFSLVDRRLPGNLKERKDVQQPNALPTADITRNNLSLGLRHLHLRPFRDAVHDG